MNGVINPGIRVTLTVSLLTVQLITLESAYTNYSVINQIDEDLKKKEGISTIENATKTSVASNVQDEHKSKNQKLINQNQLTTQDTEPLTQYLEEPVNTNERSNNNSNVKNKEIIKKYKNKEIPVVTNLEYDHVQIQNDVDTRIVNKLKEAFRLGIEKESKTKINNEKVKNESRNKIYDHLKTINDRKFKSKVERELKRQTIKCIREIWRIIEDNLPNNINFQLDSYIDNILKVVNLFMPTKIYIPMEFEESTKLKVFTMKFESKVKVNDVYLEKMHTLQRNTEKKSELILDQLRVAKFRVHVHFLNPELKIGNYLLKLAGIPLGKGSVNVIMFKLSLTLELDFNMANRTCEEFLKAGVKLTKLKDVKFEVKGGSAIGDGSKKLLLKFLSVLVKKIIKLKRKKIEDTIQKEIADVMKDINPYCNPGSEINEQFMKFVKGY